MDYALLKLIHVSAVVASISLFVTRGIWMLARSPRMDSRRTEYLTHVIDTVLLLAALGMVAMAGLNPLDHAWLLAKLFGLLAYIGFGSLALRRGKTRRQQVISFFLALVMLGYILAVAISKQCVPGLF